MKNPQQALEDLYCNLTCLSGKTLEVDRFREMIAHEIALTFPDSPFSRIQTIEKYKEQVRNAEKKLIKAKIVRGSEVRKARYFHPDVYPWPRGVSQHCVEGKLYDVYHLLTDGQHSQTIYPGDLVIMDDMENPLYLIPPLDSNRSNLWDIESIEVLPD